MLTFAEKQAALQAAEEFDGDIRHEWTSASGKP